MPTFKERLRSRTGLALAGIILFAGGGAAGSAVTRAIAPIDVMAPGNPVPIAQIADAAQPWVGAPIITARGRIAEVYGGQFVLADSTGRVLVDAGPRAANMVAANQEVTVQGGFRDGVIRARYLVGADGRVAALGRGRHGGPDGPGRRHGRPDFEDDMPPPPPAEQAPQPSPGNQVG